MSGRRGVIVRRSLLAAAAVALAVALVWAFVRPDAARPEGSQPPAAQAVAVGSTLKPRACYRPAAGAFVPTRMSVPGVVRDAEVLALPRDANNVPSAPPISGAGKTQFAWSVAPDPLPGAAKGNALFNAHTWPDGTALGNKLLAGLEVGGRLVVHGKAADGSPRTLCYRVTKKDVIVASDGSWEYYERNAPHQIALIVCSPPRLGPGHWLKRTIWYASPMGS